MKDKFMLYYANVVVQKLWMMGLITESERNILIEKNKEFYLSA